MLYTSQFNYNGEYKRLDITAASKDPIGSIFAPNWDLVLKYKQGQSTQEQYIYGYNQIINNQFINNKQIFDQVANIIFKSNIVFVCYCPANAFCHRLILKDMFINSNRYKNKYSEPLQYGGEI
jgi:uncharacterized protein YeaO (DUF488 family)